MIDKCKLAEKQRLATLHRYDMLDTPPEEAFDRITRLARAALRTEIALVSLVDDARQWFKSRQGLEATETPRDISFCTHAIRNNEPLIVADTLKDERFKDTPLVTGAPGICFYAGVPLKMPDGSNIGTLCVIDRQPRDLSDLEAATLYDLARLVVDELELRQIAMTDSLTGLQTRRAFDAQIDQEIERARRYRRPASMVLFDLDRFKSVNDTYGHAFGDEVLRQVTAICRSQLRGEDIFGRLGGEEFAIFMPETDLDGAMDAAERLRRAIEVAKIGTDVTRITVTASFGVTALTSSDRNLKDLIERADAALYRAKDCGRNRTMLYHVGDKVALVA